MLLLSVQSYRITHFLQRDSRVFCRGRDCVLTNRAFLLLASYMFITLIPSYKESLRQIRLNIQQTRGYFLLIHKLEQPQQSRVRVLLPEYAVGWCLYFAYVIVGRMM